MKLSSSFTRDVVCVVYRPHARHNVLGVGLGARRRGRGRGGRRRGSGRGRCALLRSHVCGGRRWMDGWVDGWMGERPSRPRQLVGPCEVSWD
jgi:hypothetical protein